MIPLGPIVRLHVQTANLKIGTGPNQRYDNSAVQSVDQLEIDDGGVWGIGPGGERIADIHHRDHPQSKLRGVINPISFGFTGHYDAMRSEFGVHMLNGAAAESILIDLDQLVGIQDVINGIWIDTRENGLIHLDGISVAAPCAPFSRWAMQYPDDEKPDQRVTAALQFLNDGMRGYYCRFVGSQVKVSMGDTVYVAI